MLLHIKRLCTAPVSIRTLSCSPSNAQNPLDTFPRNFPVDGEVANLLPACLQQVVLMEFRKRHDTTDTTDFCPRQLVADLLRTCRLCCGLVADLLRGSRQLVTDLRGNWCNGFWHLLRVVLFRCGRLRLCL